MRHGNKVNHLGRKYAHRKAMLSNMATSLLLHKRIKTTVAKAKELRKYVEPLINRGKEDSTHNRRMVFAKLQSEDAVTELFTAIAGKVGDRNGGYTRILKLSDNRPGDNAEVCYIELVDYNLNLLKDGKASTKKRTRRGKSTTTTTTNVVEKAEKKVEEKTDEPKTEE